MNLATFPLSSILKGRILRSMHTWSQNSPLRPCVKILFSLDTISFYIIHPGGVQGCQVSSPLSSPFPPETRPLSPPTLPTPTDPTPGHRTHKFKYSMTSGHPTTDQSTASLHYAYSTVLVRSNWLSFLHIIIVRFISFSFLTMKIIWMCILGLQCVGVLDA